MDKVINFDEWSRYRHFQAFSAMEDPHLAICLNIDVSPLIKRPAFFSTLLYLVHQTCHEIPEFHYRIEEDGKVKYYENLDINFNILAEDGLFSNHRMAVTKNLHLFRENVLNAIEAKSKRGEIFIDPSQHQNLIVTSYIPWFSFTGIKEPIFNKLDSIPRITWGKYTEAGQMPISIQVHHGLMDGIHIGDFYSLLSEKFQSQTLI